MWGGDRSDKHKIGVTYNIQHTVLTVLERARRGVLTSSLAPHHVESRARCRFEVTAKRDFSYVGRGDVGVIECVSTTHHHYPFKIDTFYILVMVKCIILLERGLASLRPRQFIPQLCAAIIR